MTPETRVTAAHAVGAADAGASQSSAGVSGNINGRRGALGPVCSRGVARGATTLKSERIAGLLRERALPVAFPTRRSSDVLGSVDIRRDPAENITDVFHSEPLDASE